MRNILLSMALSTATLLSACGDKTPDTSTEAAVVTGPSPLVSRNIPENEFQGKTRAFIEDTEGTLTQERYLAFIEAALKNQEIPPGASSLTEGQLQFLGAIFVRGAYTSELTAAEKQQVASELRMLTDVNEDGKVSESEFREMGVFLFKSKDRNSDGVIAAGEV